MKQNQLPLEQIRLVPIFQWRQNAHRREKLKQSLQSQGILSPLVGYSLGAEFFLLDGYERLGLAHELQIEMIPLALIDVSTSDALIARLDLNDETWSPIEIGLILNGAKSLFNESEIALKIAARLGINSPKQIREYASLVELPLAIKRAYGNFSLPVLLKLMDFSSSDQEQLTQFLSPFSLNQNKLSEVLDLVFEVVHKSKSPLSFLLSELSESLDLKKSAAQTEALRHALKLKRYPRYEVKKQEWDQTKKKLKLVANQSIEPHPYFEKQGFVLQAEIKNNSDIEKTIESLKSPVFKELFNILDQN